MSTDPFPPPQEFKPSTPDPTITNLVMIILRYILTALSAAGIYHGAVSDSVLSIIAGAIVGIAMAGWAIYEKIQAKRAAHVGAVHSAVSGMPMQPTAARLPKW